MTIRELGQWNDFFLDRADEADADAEPEIDPSTLSDEQLVSVFGGRIA